MSAQAKPGRWWANRKSRLGLSPAAKPPPHVHGRPWYTEPTVGSLDPGHMEYVVRAMRLAEQGPPSRDAQALVIACAQWIRASRRLIHEHVDDGDLCTTDGLIIAAETAMREMLKMIPKSSRNADWIKVRDALSARAAKARRHRV